MDDSLVQYEVEPNYAGWTLADYVLEKLKRPVSPDRLLRMLRSRALVHDERELLPETKIWPGLKFALRKRSPGDSGEPLPLRVIFEDEALLVIDKPAGLAIHPTARYHHNTVIKLLSVERPGKYFTLAHRLDRETSGVLLLAKTREADRGIKRQLEKRVTVDKTYLAVTWGVPPHDAFRLDLPLEIDDDSRLRVRMRVAAAGTGISAATRFTVLGRARRGDRAYGLVQCDLETGRQHQIRVHLAAIGCPLVGDKLYGPDPEIFARGADQTLTDDDRTALELDRHALHAWRLAFDHPILGHRVAIEAPLPADIAAFWQSVSGEAP